MQDPCCIMTMLFLVNWCCGGAYNIAKHCIWLWRLAIINLCMLRVIHTRTLQTAVENCMCIIAEGNCHNANEQPSWYICSVASLVTVSVGALMQVCHSRTQQLCNTPGEEVIYNNKFMLVQHAVSVFFVSCAFSELAISLITSWEPTWMEGWV